MFCMKCGKETNNSNGICDECMAKENAQSVQPTATAPSGKGVAITSFALSVGALVFFLMAFMAAGGMGAIIGLIFALPAWIVSLVLGIKAVKTYKKAKADGAEVPVITFVFGLIGIIMSGMYIASCALGFAIGFIGALMLI